MGILRIIRDYVVTDIEVMLTTGEGAEYRFRESSTVDGGALTQTGTESELRIVFHGRVGFLGRGAYVTFVLKDGREMTIRRVPLGRIEIVTASPERPGFPATRKVVAPDLGSLRLFRDAYGNTGTVRRVRHRDLQLFPTPAAKP